MGPDTPTQTMLLQAMVQCPNPTNDFFAVMVCNDADQMPYGSGTRTDRYILVDPKVSDGTEAESATYDGRSAQIAGIPLGGPQDQRASGR